MVPSSLLVSGYLIFFVWDRSVGDVNLSFYHDLLPHTSSCFGQRPSDNFFSFTIVCLLLTLFSLQQIDDAKTKTIEDVTADKTGISNDSGIIGKCYNSVKDE